MAIFIRLLGYVCKYRSRLAAAFVLALLGVGLELARPWPIKVIVDDVLAGHPMTPALVHLAAVLPGAGTRQGLLAWCVAAAAVTVIGAAALSLVTTTLVVSLSQRLVYDLSRDLLGKLQSLSLAYHGRQRVGDLLQRVSGDVFVVHFAVSEIALPGTISLLSLAGMFAIMLRLDAPLALVALGVVPLLGLTLAGFTRPLNATTTEQYERQGALMTLVEQSLSAIKAVQGFAREPYMLRKMEAGARELGDAYNAATRVSAAYKEAIAVITGVATAALLGLGAEHVIAGRLSVGDLLVFLGYLAALYGPVSALSSSVGYAVAVVARGRRVFDVLDCGDEIPDRPGARALGRAQGDVAFEDVTFGYPGEDGGRGRPVLRGVSLHARPGQIVAIVGATGAGKSSLVSLLSRFHDPWEGSIRVDGQDVRDLSLRSLRENVSLVLQDPFLFPMSVADNIAFGRPDATREEIIGAARIAHAHDFIMRLSGDYDTVIGEKGSTLSGGERQRIAIARALLKDAPILILDEPTSALDAHTEARIFDALLHLMRDRTTFIISHRLTTIRCADMILALDDGRIVEHGTHESLLAAGSVYANLYKHQHLAVL